MRGCQLHSNAIIGNSAIIKILIKPPYKYIVNMVLDVLAGAILLAFGFFVVYFAVESDKNDRSFLIILIIGIALILIGGWIILATITLEMLLKKLAGLVLAIIGLFMLAGFPDIGDYQAKGMSKAAMLIGLILLIVGVYLFIF